MPKAYKINPEIVTLILERKKKNPGISSRRLSLDLSRELKVRVSKSTINEVFKESGLSLPQGRPLTKPRPRIQMPRLPELELKKETQPIAEIKPPPPVPPSEPKKEIPAPPPPSPPTPPPEPKKEISAPPAQPPAPEPLKEKPTPEPVQEKPAPTPKEPPKEIKIPPPEIEAAPSVEMPQEPLVLTETTGAILLKAADYLAGGSLYLQENLWPNFPRDKKEALLKIEGLIYLPLFSANLPAAEETLLKLWPLLGRKLSATPLCAALTELEPAKATCPELWRGLLSRMQEVRCVKINFSDTSDLVYLDGQFYTAWSTPHLAYDFNSTLFCVKRLLNRYLQEGPAFLLLMAPGYAAPTDEFFNFVFGLRGQNKKIARVTLYGNKLEELESHGISQHKKPALVFGLWPWQFSACRKVKKIGQFRAFTFAGLQKELFLADIELDLTVPQTNVPFTFRGAALKMGLAEKVRLVVLTDGPAGAFKAEDLANLYLDNWPNLEEAFQDYSRKIELFTYTAHSQSNFTAELAQLKPENALDFPRLFDYYLQALDLYVRWHFLPAGYEKEGFAAVKERFYSLKTELRKEGNCTRVVFHPENNFAFLKDLQYAVRRLNEREIQFTDGSRIWFSAANQ